MRLWGLKTTGGPDVPEAGDRHPAPLPLRLCGGVQGDLTQSVERQGFLGLCFFLPWTHFLIPWPHPCPLILRKQDCFFADNELWIVMEFCMGGSVADMLDATEKTLTEPQVRFRASVRGQICHATYWTATTTDVLVRSTHTRALIHIHVHAQSIQIRAICACAALGLAYLHGNHHIHRCVTYPTHVSGNDRQTDKRNKA